MPKHFGHHEKQGLKAIVLKNQIFFYYKRIIFKANEIKAKTTSQGISRL